MKIGLRKRQRGLDVFIVVGVLARMVADVQMDVCSSGCACAVVFLLKDQSR